MALPGLGYGKAFDLHSGSVETQLYQQEVIIQRGVTRELN